MLSAKYHLFFWALSSLSLFLALLRERYRPFLHNVFADSLLEHIIYGLGTFVMWPGERPRWFVWIYFFSLSALCVAAHEMLSEVDFMGKMPSSIDRMDEGQLRMLIAHLLASFTILGTLEPMRRNRRDIEASGVGIVWLHPLRQGRNQSAIRSTFMGLLGFASIVGLIQLGVSHFFGFWVDLAGFWFPKNLTLKQVFIHAWALSPLLDVAETVIYTTSRFIRPTWYWRKEVAIHSQP